MSEFKKITTVRLPFDRRHENSSKNYGIHGLDIWFILVGPKGAVQFAVTFPIYLPHVDAEYRTKFPGWEERKKISGIDVGYHSPHPMYEGQTQMETECEYVEGGKCFYDGSTLATDPWIKQIFSVRGDAPEKLLWEKLEQEYKDRFET